VVEHRWRMIAQHGWMRRMQDLQALIAHRPPAVQETARRLVAVARELVPDAVESCEGGDFGVGSAPGYKGLVFVITPLADAVRLGIARGAELEDPAALMRGRGAVHRHVRLTDPAQADDPALRDLMMRAAAARRLTGGSDPVQVNGA
jgi:hypothetical protein